MDDETRVQELEERIELMKSVYYKGFDDALGNARLDCWLYLNHKRDSAKKETAVRNIERVERHFQDKIPYERIRDDQDYASVFDVKRLLEEYGVMVRAFFDNPSAEKFNQIQEKNSEIKRKGDILDRNFRRLIKELRGMPGYKDYRVIVIDYKGDEFLF